MANTNNKFVHQDGTNAPTDLVNGYQVADTTAEQLPGIKGDFLFARNTSRLYLHQGDHHSVIYHSEDPPPYPTSLPPAPLVAIQSSGTVTLIDNWDVLLASGDNAVLTLPSANTAKKKLYQIKAWYANNIRINPPVSEVIDPSPGYIILNHTQSVTLFPFGSNTWVIL